VFDERSSAKVFYKTLNRESPGEEPENVEDDSELGAASTTADQEIVDVILSGKVSTASARARFSSLALPFLFPDQPFSVRTRPSTRLGLLGSRTGLGRPCCAHSAARAPLPRCQPLSSTYRFL
jgi:hypothetical protein